MKPTSTLKSLAIGLLLITSILTGCKKDPPQIPDEIFTWGSTNSHKPSKIASAAKADSTINTSADSNSPADRDVPSSHP